MSKRIIIACIWWILILAAAVTTGCSRETGPAQGPAAVRGGDGDNGDILQSGFRIRRDAARNRIWVLGLDYVRVYDGQSKTLIRKIALSSWSVARFACDPDMVLDASGSAIISSNVQPRLWRIDAGSFEVREHPVTLQGRERWDVGFGALAIGVDGTLLAMTSVTEALWRIDLTKGSGSMVPPAGAPVNVCGLRTWSPSRTASRFQPSGNFVAAAASDGAAVSAGTDIIQLVGGPDITSERGRP